MRKKINAYLLLAALIAAPLCMGAFDSWSGHVERVIPFSQSVTLGTTALVATAVPLVSHNVRSITITDSASGVVRLYSTSDNSLGSNMIGSWGVIANTPLVIREDELGQGIGTAVGSALYVDAATGTLSLMVRIREDPQRPPR